MKLYYIGPMFRYKRPQARRRQFSQFGVEAFGSMDPMLDAEIISLAHDFYVSLGLDRIKARINTIGAPVPATLPGHIKQVLSGGWTSCAGIASSGMNATLRILDCKNERCSRIASEVGSIDPFLCDECSEHFEAVKTSLDELSIPYVIDPAIVRALTTTPRQCLSS